MRKLSATLFWLLLASLGAWAYMVLAFRRGEPVNSAFVLIAALCTYAIGYRFYSKWIATRVLLLDERRAPPAEVHDDGKDFVKTNKWIVFGHHFAAISGPGPLVGPVLAAQFGYLPGTLWILIGVVLGGAVQDFVILFLSIRRDGKSLGQMVSEELNTKAGAIAMLAILAIMVILLAVLALVVVRALAESPWGVFTVSMTVPIAMCMGLYLRYGRVGKVLETSMVGIVCLLLAVWGGKLVHENASWAAAFGLKDLPLAWCIIAYGLAASVLPVWLLLAPRDYLSTFMKLGTIFALALGIFLVLPDLHMPAITTFVDGSGPVVAGKVFPFCFITIACGAISGFHTLIASGTTPKMITRESYARPVGYGAMCLESLVAIMALVAACTLDPGVYLSMNIKGDGAATVAKVTALGYPVTFEHMERLAHQIGEKSLFGRTGGAATLAVGMAVIFSRAVNERWLDLWYHFAIMFEALFILTTIDAGTRVGRYILQDVLGRVWHPLGDTRHFGANLLASLVMVGGWGYFLIQGVRDPLGGINSLWPLFGVANQMLAAIALCLATTIILKTQLLPTAVTAGTGRPWLALLTLLPLIWLLAVTMTAGVQKIWHSDPRIGFLAQAQTLERSLPALEQALETARQSGAVSQIAAAHKELRRTRTLIFNSALDAAVAGVFLVLVTLILAFSVREWVLLLARKKLAELRETPPVWLPEYAIVESRPLKILSLLGLAIALARELSGDAAADRVLAERTQVGGATYENGIQRPAPCCEGCTSESTTGDIHSREDRNRAYVESTERKYAGVTRCC